LSLQIFDPRFHAVGQQAGALEKLCTGAIWSEGPVWMQEDDSVLWSDIPNNRILRWSAKDGMQVWREQAEFTNGHTREADGSLLHCSHGQRAIVRTRFGAGLAQAGDEVVVSHYQGKRLNSPNDVIVKSDGTIWFTDPPYGILSDREGHRAESELPGCFVFRFDPATLDLQIASDWLEHPNGLAFSPDEKTLYVSDTSAAVRQDGGGKHHIVAFDVEGGAQLTHPRVFAEITPGLSDGFRLDQHGFIYTSCEAGVQVYHPDGQRLAMIGVPEKVGNLTFGGRERNELYICASTSLYRMRLQTRGIQCP
jgi:gluconolactonase